MLCGERMGSSFDAEERVYYEAEIRAREMMMADRKAELERQRLLDLESKERQDISRNQTASSDEETQVESFFRSPIGVLLYDCRPLADLSIVMLNRVPMITSCRLSRRRSEADPTACWGRKRKKGLLQVRYLAA